MCEKHVLDNISAQIVADARNRLGSRLQQVLLYGSYARGEYDDGSDIDIMILADVTAEEANRLDREMITLTSRLGLEYDVLISLYVKDCASFNQWKDVLPFYKNVLRDGVNLMSDATRITLAKPSPDETRECHVD